jgi:zinc/manganese transport system substrate-binding protein
MRVYLVLLLSSLCAIAAHEAAVADAPALKVVTSFTILSDLTREVGADWVNVQSLVGPDADAHVYQPTPADVRAVGNAHIVILNGLGFEGWMSRLLDSAQFRGTVVVASQGVTPRKLEGQPDPHAWQDPNNVRIYVNNIGRALEQALPAHAAQLAENERRYLEKLEQLNGALHTEFAAIPASRRRIITTHDAFGYFGAAYAIEFLPVQGRTTESEPSAAAVGRLVEQAKSHRAVAVFLENITDPRMMRQLAQDTGLKVGGRLYSDALARPGEPASTYLGMVRANADALLGVMKGN